MKKTSKRKGGLADIIRSRKAPGAKVVKPADKRYLENNAGPKAR